MKKQIPLTPILALVLVIVAAVGWFALIGPKRSADTALADEIAGLEQQLELTAKPTKPEKPEAAPEAAIGVADVFRLAKAMPDREDMPGMLLELNSIALSTGVHFVSIQPGEPLTKDTYYSVPVTLTFVGNYYDLTDFLFRLRNLVSVRDGVLEADGRLYSLDGIEFKEAKRGFPHIEAVLTVSAFAYGVPEGVAPPPGAAPTPPPGEATTTGATTTGETSTTSDEQAPPADPTGDAQAAGGTG